MSENLKKLNIHLLSHKHIIDKVYSKNIFEKENDSYALKDELFEINIAYDAKPGGDRRKRRKISISLDEITSKIKENHAKFLENFLPEINETSNGGALSFVDHFYKNSKYDAEKIFNGENSSNYSVITSMNDESFIIPPQCRFFNNNVKNISSFLGDAEKFDLIVIDPPWWNKYIRRARAVNYEQSYSMLDNKDISDIPIGDLLSENGIVVIWCTNSNMHIKAIQEDFVKKWNVKLIGNWFWIKITKSGEPVCKFNDPTKKQPYEQLFVAVNNEASTKYEELISKELFIYSIPSAFHSHKPPVFELFSELLPDNPKCLEIFARNLYPHFTSIGLEVLKLQNIKLFNCK